MMTITPRFERPGWVHGWSWPYLCVDTMGAAGASLVNGQTGETLARVDSWFAGWMSLASAMMLNDVPGGGQRRSLLATTGDVTLCLDPSATVVGARASSGNWVSCCEGVLRLDGVEIDRGRLLDQSVQIAGDWIAVQFYAGPDDLEPEWTRWKVRVYNHGLPQRDVTPRVPAHRQYLCNDGVFVYNDNARTFIDRPTGTITEVTATTPPMEMNPVMDEASGLVWSVIGELGDRLLVRTPQATTGWVLQLPFGCSGFSIEYAANAWQLCWHNNTGRCGVAAVTLNPADAETLPVQMVAPVDPPQVALHAAPTSGPSPLTVKAMLVTAPTSGSVTMMRYLLDGVADGGNDLWTHDYKITAAGQHLIKARAAGLGGSMETTPQTVVVTAPPPPPDPFTVGLNALFGEPTFPAQLDLMVEKGVQSIRTGLDKNPVGVLAQLAEHPSITPLFNIDAYYLDAMYAQTAAVPVGSVVEFGNEDINGTGCGRRHPNMTAAQYATNADAFRVLAAEKRLTVYYGAIGNLGRDLIWLAEVLRLCPWMERVSVHHYPTALEMPSAQNIADLKRAIGRRRFRVTETGVKCGPKCYQTGWWIFKKWNAIDEPQQLAWFKQVKAFWKAVSNCDGIDWYQHRSGGPNEPGLNGPPPAEAPRLAWGGFIS
jgi:hypothetical protein